MSCAVDRIVVTGMGLVSAAGSSIDALVTSLRNATACVKPITAFDASGMTMTHAGEVPDFNPCDHFSWTQVRTVDRGTQLAVSAAEQALKQAGFMGDDLSHGIGVAVGVSGAQQYQNFPVTGDRTYPISRRIALYSARGTPSFQADFLARVYRLDGPRVAFSSASLGGLLAISHAMDLLHAGHAPAMLVGGGEYQTLMNALGMDMLGVSTHGVCTPFSGESGMCFGDAAAFMVLETLKNAEERGAQPLGELISCGISADAYKGITNDPSGNGMIRAINKAVSKLDRCASQIAWIRACGTGNQSQDTAECIALNTCFGESLPPVTSTEPYFGHVNGVSSVLGAVVAFTAAKENLPPVMPIGEKLRPGSALPLVSKETNVKGDWLLTALAFGGVNGALVGGPFVSRPTKPRRKNVVHVAGMGVVSRFGCGLDKFVGGLSSGNDVSMLPNPTAYYIDEARFPTSIRGISLRRRERLVRWGLIAATEALLPEYLDGRDPARTGLLLGLTRGAASPYGRFVDEVLSGRFTASASRSMLKMSRFSVASELASALGLKGYSGVMTPGVHGGVQLLAHGAELLKASADLDGLLVIAIDEWSDMLASIYKELKLLDNVLKPYDVSAKGTIGGEGAAAMLLVKQASNSAGSVKGTNNWGCIRGCGFAGDTGVRPDSDGKRYSRAMLQAIKQAGVSPKDIGFTLGQGCGWTEHDSREIAAIETVKADMVVSGVLARTGMTECAGGLFSAISALTSMHYGSIQPVGGVGVPTGNVDYVVDTARTGVYEHALVVGSSERGSHGAVVMSV